MSRKIRESEFYGLLSNVSYRELKKKNTNLFKEISKQTGLAPAWIDSVLQLYCHCGRSDQVEWLGIPPDKLRSLRKEYLEIRSTNLERAAQAIETPPESKETSN